MLKDLVKIANKLDSLGLTKEADLLDLIINKRATLISDSDSWLQRFGDLLEERFGATIEGDAIILEGGESLSTPTTASEASHILKNLGMKGEEISEALQLTGEVFEEPPVNIEDVKAAFISQFMESRDLDSLEVTSIEWNSEPSDYPHYIVKAMGTYRPFKFKADDYFRDHPAGKSDKIKEYPLNVDFMLQDWGTPVEGEDGSTYYFYGED